MHPAFCDNLLLYKYEGWPLLARTGVEDLHPGPPAVTARRDHILEPGHLALHAMAGAPVPQVGTRRLALARHANRGTSLKGLCILIPSTSMHSFVHFKHHTIFVCVFLLSFEVLEVRPDLVLLLGSPSELTVLAGQQHPGLSQGRLVVPQASPGGRGGVPGAGLGLAGARLVLAQVRTAGPSIVLMPCDIPGTVCCTGGAGGAALAPRTPGGHQAVYDSTVVLEVRTAVPHVDTVMVAVAGLVLQVLILPSSDRRLLTDTVSILSFTALLSLPTAALERALELVDQQDVEDDTQD